MTGRSTIASRDVPLLYAGLLPWVRYTGFAGHRVLVRRYKRMITKRLPVFEALVKASDLG